jgi:hypothetical protein
VFYNAVEMLSDELDISLEAFKKRCLEAPDLVIDQIRTKELLSNPLQLACDVKLKGSETPFITKGTDLGQHLDQFIQSLARNSEFDSSPQILPTAQINDYLQTKIGRKFEKIIKKLLKSKKIGVANKPFANDPDLKNIINHFGELICKYITTPMTISGVLNAFKTKGLVDLIEQSTRTAFVAMAVLNNHTGFTRQTGGDRKDQLIKLGLSVLFQDIACILDPGSYIPSDEKHCERSSDIAAEMGLPASCAETIRHHHRTKDTDGHPILSTQSPPMSECVAVVTNDFMRCTSSNELALSIDESIYVLSYYADRQFYDRGSVQALGQICLGNRKQLIISKALNLVNQCPYESRPFLWDVNSALPNRLICKNTSCNHISEEEINLYQDILFHGPLTDFHIPKGQFYKCKLLTRRLNLWLLNSDLFKKAN